jgi:hypothetical protein
VPNLRRPKALRVLSAFLPFEGKARLACQEGWIDEPVTVRAPQINQKRAEVRNLVALLQMWQG